LNIDLISLVFDHLLTLQLHLKEIILAIETFLLKFKALVFGLRWLMMHSFDEILPSVYVSLHQRKQLFLLPQFVLQSGLLLVVELQLNDSLVLHIIKVFQRVLDHWLALLCLLSMWLLNLCQWQEITLIFLIDMLRNHFLVIKII
jgi:hypothetical protein